MEKDNNAQTAIDLLASDSAILGCTWDERGIPPIRGTFAAPLPLRDWGIFRCPVPKAKVNTESKVRQK